MKGHVAATYQFLVGVFYQRYSHPVFKGIDVLCINTLQLSLAMQNPQKSMGI
jgi:hypothetical protein